MYYNRPRLIVFPWIWSAAEIGQIDFSHIRLPGVNSSANSSSAPASEGRGLGASPSNGERQTVGEETTSPMVGEEEQLGHDGDDDDGDLGLGAAGGESLVLLHAPGGSKQLLETLLDSL